MSAAVTLLLVNITLNLIMVVGLQIHGQKYWAKRLFEFVSKVVEVKSWAKDEKHLYCFDMFTSDDWDN
jgi:hypothetical protein